MSRPRRATKLWVVHALVGFSCVLPLLFVLGLFGGVDGRPLWSVGLLVTVVGAAVAVFVLPAVLRCRDGDGRGRTPSGDRSSCDVRGSDH